MFNILARHNISVDLITTSEVSIALTMDTTGATSVGGSLLTTSLLTELSSLCRVEVEENLALVAIIGNQLSRACGVGKEVFGVLDPFNIRLICYGASSYNLCFWYRAKKPNRWCALCITTCSNKSLSLIAAQHAAPLRLKIR